MLSEQLKPGMAKKLVEAVFRADCPFCEKEVDTIGDTNPIVIHVCKIAGANFRVLEKYWNHRPGEATARRVALEVAKSTLSIMLTGATNPARAIEIMFTTINKLLEEKP